MKSVYTSSSAFGISNPQSFSVIETKPFGKSWFVVVDHVLKGPLWEGEDLGTARDLAEAYMQINDLAFIGGNIFNSPHDFEINACGKNLRYSDDGLEIIPQKFIDLEFVFNKTKSMEEGCLLHWNRDWTVWRDFVEEDLCDSFAALESSSYLIEFNSHQDEDDKCGVKHSVLIDFKGGGQQLSITVISDGSRQFERSEFDGLVHNYFPRFMRSTVVAEDDVKPFNSSFPLLNQVSDQSLDKPFIAIEGGDALVALCESEPWAMQCGINGKPLPLVIQHDGNGSLADVDSAEILKQTLAGKAIKTKLTELARSKILASQGENGVVMGQVLPDGNQFATLLNGTGFTLESAQVETLQGSSTRSEWLKYRLWVRGELVLDVGSDILMSTGLPLQLHQILSDEQTKFDHYSEYGSVAIGQTLATLLASGSGDGLSDSNHLRSRADRFLESTTAQQIKLVASDLVCGKIKIVDGYLMDCISADHRDALKSATVEI